MSAPLAAVEAGLKKVDILDVGGGFIDLRGAVTHEAAAAMMEAGWRPNEWLTTYATAKAEYRWGGSLSAYAGAGVRIRW